MKLNNNDDSHNSGLNLLIYNMLLDIESHPAWVCGLKQTLKHLKLCYKVTPCVGVWIETDNERIVLRNFLSHPAWVCGLKHYHYSNWSVLIPSHPAWVCGLKLHNFKDN